MADQFGVFAAGDISTSTQTAVASASGAVAAPANLQVGDTMYLFAVNGYPRNFGNITRKQSAANGGSSADDTSSWTKNYAETTTNNMRALVWSKVATSADIGATWTFSSLSGTTTTNLLLLRIPLGKLAPADSEISTASASTTGNSPAPGKITADPTDFTIIVYQACSGTTTGAFSAVNYPSAPTWNQNVKFSGSGTGSNGYNSATIMISKIGGAQNTNDLPIASVNIGTKKFDWVVFSIAFDPVATIEPGRYHHADAAA